WRHTLAALPRRHRAQCALGHSCRRNHGGDVVARRIQPDVDAAHAAHQDAAGRARRFLCVDAARNRVGLYADLLRDDHSTARRDATPRRRAGHAGVPHMSEAQGVAVRLDACGKTFADGTVAVEPLSLTIARGETVVFLGPSGCGKTTTLRLI